MLTLRALAVLCLPATLALSACATAVPRGEPAPVEASTPAPGGDNAATARPTPPVPVVTPGPAADSFLGRPVADLEALLGPPDLVRVEGGSEFRRYDVTEECRAYAVVQPAGGTVASLTTGAAVQGLPAPAFEDCTATEGFVGS